MANFGAENPSVMDGTDFAKQKRLVLCFDGTGNRFAGEETDTNIVKLYQMLDRTVENQYHYYQPGIGTYVLNESATLGPLSRLWSNINLTVDQAVGTSFKHHVLAGYQFIMRYYSPGDCIYIFGFSRGSYTARFLAQMLQSVGLLSKGNEEMVRFAWKAFSDFWKSAKDNSAEDLKRRELMVKFQKTFCRSVRVHFLGLFDCVNSVGQFEVPFWRTTPPYIPNPAATHIRHAVSIHERRIKFKPALLTGFVNPGISDIKEVWFAGNHGDVGGGWGRRSTVQNHLLSDTPLAWMVQELEALPATQNKLKFETYHIPYSDKEHGSIDHALMLDEDEHLTHAEKVTMSMRPHDLLSLSNGAGWLKTIFWWLLELLPISSRLELEGNEWVPRYWPPNFGARRDIPNGADIHPSVHVLYKNGVLKAEEMPKHGGDGPPVMLTTRLTKVIGQVGKKGFSSAIDANILTKSPPNQTEPSLDGKPINVLGKTYQRVVGSFARPEKPKLPVLAKVEATVETERKKPKSWFYDTPPSSPDEEQRQPVKTSGGGGEGQHEPEIAAKQW